MKFIKLTEALGNDETRVCIINFEYVQCFGNGAKGKDTHIRLHDKSFFFVKESVEEIAAKLNLQITNMSEANKKSLDLI